MSLKRNNGPSFGQEPVSDRTIFAFSRTERVRGGRIVSGRLLPDLTPESPQVRAAISEWPGSVGVQERPDGGWDLLLFEPEPRSERWWLHVLLFAVTLFSTVVAGGLLAGQPPIYFRALPLFGDWWAPLPVTLDASGLAAGLPFGLSLIGVLALHEGGHYFAARHHRISVTPPFFIPFPPYLSIIGTLGAFIRLRSPVMSRDALLDVGVAGPFMSFIASIPLLWWGLSHSALASIPHAAPNAFLIRFAGEGFWLGESLASSLMVGIILEAGPGQAVVLHPVAFAGWLGLFVTALNLLPISQLDGGHILYAMVGRSQRPLALLFFLALVPLGFLWAGWWVWAVLVYVIGRGRISHPPVFGAERGLSPLRRIVGLLAAATFILCFVPQPFSL